MLPCQSVSDDGLQIVITRLPLVSFERIRLQNAVLYGGSEPIALNSVLVARDSPDPISRPA